jgi:transcriptional regulator with XRE-family HTH domain
MVAKTSSWLESEDNVAAQVRLERESRGWSTAELAERMRAVGCPINQSAIWRIESGTPRRRISVDELVAMARVFETTLQDLTLPPVLHVHKKLMRMVADHYTNIVGIADTAKDLWNGYLELGTAARGHPDAVKLMFDRNSARAELKDGRHMTSLEVEVGRAVKTTEDSYSEFMKLMTAILEATYEQRAKAMEKAKSARPDEEQ